MTNWKSGKKHLIFVKESILVENPVTKDWSLKSNAEKFLFYIRSQQELSESYLLSINHEDVDLQKRLTKTGIDCFLNNICIDKFDVSPEEEGYWIKFMLIRNILAKDTMLFVTDLNIALAAAGTGIQTIVIDANESANKKHSNGHVKIINNLTELLPNKITYVDLIHAS